MRLDGTGRFIRGCLLATVLIAISPNFAEAAPLSDILTERVQGSRWSSPYSWTYAYDIGFSDLEVNVQLRINLDGFNPDQSLIDTWEQGIEGMWGLQFDLVDGDYRYHVNFDAVLLNYPPPGYHHSVVVRDGQSRGNMLEWWTTCDWGSSYNGEYVAHEAGHMFGLYDEYSGGAIDTAGPIMDSSSIMGSLNGVAKERHYDPFRDWLQDRGGRTLTIGQYDPDWVIPEPSTLLLLCVGAVFIRPRPSS